MCVCVWGRAAVGAGASKSEPGWRVVGNSRSSHFPPICIQTFCGPGGGGQNFKLNSTLDPKMASIGSRYASCNCESRICNLIIDYR